MEGQRFSKQLARRAAEAAPTASRPLRGNPYQVKLATEVLRHALLSIAAFGIRQ